MIVITKHLEASLGTFLIGCEPRVLPVLRRKLLRCKAIVRMSSIQMERTRLCSIELQGSFPTHVDWRRYRATVTVTHAMCSSNPLCNNP